MLKKILNIFTNRKTEQQKRDDTTLIEGKNMFTPYKGSGTNEIYNLLFCDNAFLFYPKDGAEPANWHKILFNNPNKDSVLSLAEDKNSESRVRALAYNWLRENGYNVSENTLLGVIIEVSLEDGLDTLAVFKDRSIRYINYSEKMVFIEQLDDSDKIAILAKEFFEVSDIIYKGLKPDIQNRYTYPTNYGVKVTFLTSQGLSSFLTTMDELNSQKVTALFLNKATDILLYVTGATK